MRYLFALIVMMALSAAFVPSQAQFRVNVNFNLNSQPEWGPHGYDYAEYYYLPDIDVYYNVPRHEFFYFDRGRWVSRNYLPSRYGNYDLYHGYKVVINERDPWRRHDYYRSRYVTYRDRNDQGCIRDYRRMDRNRDNDGYNERHDNGKHKGWYKNGKAYNNNGRDYDNDYRRDNRDNDRRNDDRLGRW